MYYRDSNQRGKTFEVIVKDFSPKDYKTYAIVETDRRFWTISLPEDQKKKNFIDGIFIGNELPLANTDEDRVALTRMHGLKRTFTVPLREKDLPAERPLVRP